MHLRRGDLLYGLLASDILVDLGGALIELLPGNLVVEGHVFGGTKELGEEVELDAAKKMLT